jgi:hypothetical protein
LTLVFPSLLHCGNRGISWKRFLSLSIPKS